MSKWITIAILLIVSCSSPPTQEMIDAQESVTQAQRYGADKYAPEELKEAQDALSLAKEKMEAKKYRDAKRYALRAKEKADLASQKATPALVAEGNIKSAEKALKEVQEEYKESFQQYEKEIKNLQLESDLSYIEKRVAKLREDLDSSKYTTAEYDAKRYKNQLEELMLKIRSVTLADERVRPFLGKEVYLWYKGQISKIILWSKPGAKTTNARVIRELQKSPSRVGCILLGHNRTVTNSNYFLIRLSDGTEGWVGRPFLFRSPTGIRHILPNPLTGEP